MQTIEKTNGNGGEPDADQRTRRMVEEGLNAVARVQQERDQCSKELGQMQTRLASTEAELGALNLAYQRLLLEIDEYRRQRDHAVARRAEVEAVFNAALLIMQKHQTTTVADETATVAAEVEEGGLPI